MNGGIELETCIICKKEFEKVWKGSPILEKADDKLNTHFSRDLKQFCLVCRLEFASEMLETTLQELKILKKSK